MTTAFQANAFQNNSFQIDVVVAAATGSAVWERENPRRTRRTLSTRATVFSEFRARLRLQVEAKVIPLRPRDLPLPIAEPPKPIVIGVRGNRLSVLTAFGARLGFSIEDQPMINFLKDYLGNQATVTTAFSARMAFIVEDPPPDEKSLAFIAFFQDFLDGV